MICLTRFQTGVDRYLSTKKYNVQTSLSGQVVEWLSSCSRLFLYSLHENWTLVEFRNLGIQEFRNCNMNLFLILIPQSLNSQFLNLAPYSHYH